MAQSTAGGPAVSITDCRIDEPATGDEARGYWSLALEAVLGATEPREILGDRPVGTRKPDVEQ